VLPFGVGDRVFVMPDPAPDLAWVGAVRAIEGDRVTIELPPAPEGVPPLAPGAMTQLAVRTTDGIALVAVEVLSSDARRVHVRALASKSPLGRAPRPVSRRHLRAPLRIGCEVELAGGRCESAWMADVGAGGAEIVLPAGTPLEAAERGRITFELPGEAPWTLGLRTVRVVREDAETRAGVAFVDVDAAIEARIDGFVHFVRRTRLTRRPI
jgi:hypothetical protein